MCGIAGVALAGRATVDEGVLWRMTDSLAHRGPDGRGAFFSEGIGLGHRRLSIVDLSDAAAQPMLGPGGTALTFNGEIYNWRDVGGELARRGRTSSGDTSVLSGALDTWGEAALPRLEGMFAFGYWDPADRSLLLVRDRFGEKPLYYALLGVNGGEGVVFASELRALLEHPRVRDAASLDAAAVAQFFFHEFVPAPRSILANVKKLPAGHVLRWTERAGAMVAPYYRVPSRGPLAGRADARELTGELLRRTEAATRARLVADVPVGVFLSGGLDSSFLAACATRVHAGPRVRTFTLGFDDASFDETSHARRVAQHLGTEHTEHRLTEAELLAALPATLDWMDEPFADSSLLPMTLLARMARRDVTVALGGEGGDEILAGYPTFVADLAHGRTPAWPPFAAQLAAKVAALVPPSSGNFSLSFKARQLAQGLAATGARRHAGWLAPLVPQELARLAGPRLRDASLSAPFEAVDALPSTLHPFDAATAFYLGLYLAEGVLTKVDRATMRASLEARTPLLDTSIVELCLSLPPRFRVRGGTTKCLMREAVRPLLPASIVSRPKKGFGAPVGAWLRGPLRDLVTSTLSPASLREGGWLDPDGVQRMLAAHLAGTADLRKPLYAALIFEHWRQRWKL